jgi:hypothetical protein
MSGRSVSNSQERTPLRRHMDARVKPAHDTTRVVNPKRPESDLQCFKSSGTLPPLSASFCITCLCSQMFIEAESFVSPV